METARSSTTRPNVVHLTAAHWHSLVGGWERSPDLARDQLCDVRLINVTGDALSAQKLQLWEEVKPPHVRLVNTYGPTETTVSCTASSTPYDPGTGQITIGKPLANTQIYILDGHGAPSPIGVAGEIHIGGAGVARGYLNRPELTAERFVPDPFCGTAGGRMYRTGDLGRWRADGTIEFLGRNDFQVKVRGFRIELGEIEARLCAHDGVREAVVIAREDGPGDKRLVAYYVGDDGLGAEQLRGHLQSGLPDYMVPAAYVRLERLPLTPNGKLDRKGLPAPEGEAYAARAYEAPQGATEVRLAGIWAELLGVERVGRHDNFFELGGHSLLAMQAISLLGRADIQVSLAQLFTDPTIAALAAAHAVRSEDAIGDDCVITFRTEGSHPPLFLLYEAFGEAMYGRELVRNMTLDAPVYGLTAPKRSRDQARTLEGMAAHAIRAIRALQPVGPYRLAGWSFGGLLAYEIASQLIGADETVAFLGLLDTSRVTEKLPSHVESDDAALLGWLFLSEERCSTAGEPEMFAALVRSCQEKGIIPAHLNERDIASYLDRLRRNTRAESEYEVHALPITVHLFAAGAEPHDDPLLGWGAVLSKEQLRLVSTPGTHRSMVEQPHVTTLATALSEALGDPAPPSETLPEARFAHLVRIQPGRAQARASLLYTRCGSERRQLHGTDQQIGASATGLWPTASGVRELACSSFDRGGRCSRLSSGPDRTVSRGRDPSARTLVRWLGRLRDGIATAFRRATCRIPDDHR
ncbi:thioesterase domain-containing protein/aryl carrier-like protein [Bradyrhizobium sp. USDA 4369]